MSSATVRGIATALGVSPATVSRSLNNSPDVSESVRARVIAEARRLGYELPRKASVHGRIGITYFNETSGPKFSGYDAVVWGGVARAAIGLKYDVVVIDPQDRAPQESFGSFVARKGVDGLIIRVDAETRHWCAVIADEGIPHVVLADRFEQENVNYVCCNSFAPAKAAVEHLIHLGHRRIAVCHNTILDTDHGDRIAGYKAALAEAGLPVEPERIISLHADVADGAAAFNRLMAAPEPPTAIFFTDPGLTAGALRRALEVGVRVPEELSIIGVDDERLRRMTYPIFTAVCQNAPELGHMAARWLCRQLGARGGRQKSGQSLRQEIEAFLEVNQTTAPPPPVPLRITPLGQRIPYEIAPPHP